MKTKLSASFLEESHNVNNIDTCLHKMSLFTYGLQKSFGLGLLGDIFCIKWCSYWIKVPVFVWLFENKNKFLYFNADDTIYPVTSCENVSNCSPFMFLFYSRLIFPWLAFFQESYCVGKWILWLHNQAYTWSICYFKLYSYLQSVLKSKDEKERQSNSSKIMNVTLFGRSSDCFASIFHT